jgi:hypothetical protein
VRCPESGISCEIKIEKSNGMFMKAANKAKIEGFVEDPKTKELKHRITGSWLSHIDIEKFDSKSKSWKNKTRVYEQIRIEDPKEDEEWDTML